MSLKSKIQALITAANAKTGETDATLTDAVQTLVDGYGQGGGLPEGITELYTGTFTPTEAVTTYTINHNLGKYPKAFICFIDTTFERISSYNNGAITGFCQFLFNRNKDNYANAYTATYIAQSSGNPYAGGGAVGVVEGTDLNNVVMKSSSGNFKPTVGVRVEGEQTTVPAVYRWIFLA